MNPLETTPVRVHVVCDFCGKEFHATFFNDAVLTEAWACCVRCGWRNHAKGSSAPLEYQAREWFVDDEANIERGEQ